MIGRLADLPICRFVDLAIFVETFPRYNIPPFTYSATPARGLPSKGEPIHEHYTNDYEQHTNDYEDYTNDLLIDKLVHWQIDSLAN